MNTGLAVGRARAVARGVGCDRGRCEGGRGSAFEAPADASRDRRGALRR